MRIGIVMMLTVDVLRQASEGDVHRLIQSINYLMIAREREGGWGLHMYIFIDR